MQECRQKYQELADWHQAIRWDTMRAKSFFESLVKQIEDSIPQIALFTLISKYQDDRTQDRFYQLLDDIIQSLQEFYDRYQEESSRNLFDLNDFIHTCRATGYFSQLNSLYIQASAIAAPIIIQELK